MKVVNSKKGTKMMPIDVCFFVGKYSVEKLPIAMDIITVERIVFNVNDTTIMNSIVSDAIKSLCIKYEQNYDDIENSDYYQFTVESKSFVKKAEGGGSRITGYVEAETFYSAINAQINEKELIAEINGMEITADINEKELIAEPQVLPKKKSRKKKQKTGGDT